MEIWSVEWEQQVHMASHHALKLSPADARTLKSTRLFSALSESDFLSLSDALTIVTLAPGQPLFDEGAPAEWLFVVLDGWVVLYRDRPDGERAVIHLFGPGESFAEALILEGARYPVSAEAASSLGGARRKTPLRTRFWRLGRSFPLA